MSDYLRIAREVMRERQKSDLAEPLEDALRGRAIELWSDALGERLWLVADDNDANLLREARGAIYTAAEARRIVAIADRTIVAEVHRWKREFDGILEFRAGLSRR